MSKRTELVIAHQILAAAKIIVEELTALGYDDDCAAAEFKTLKSNHFDGQAAMRLIVMSVNTYDGIKCPHCHEPLGEPGQQLLTLTLTRGQQMALLDVLMAYIRTDEPQEFVNCSTPDGETTTTGDLLRLLTP